MSFKCCDNKKYNLVKSFKKPPFGEPKYKKKDYKRLLYKCSRCGHFINKSNINFDQVYNQSYSKLAYGPSLKKKLYDIFNLKKNLIIIIE